MPSATVHTWSELEPDHPMPRLERRRVVAGRMMLSYLNMAKGFSIDPHHHENEQIVLVLEGRCRFRVGAPGGSATETLELGAGQVLVVPPNVPHACEALEDSILIDAFSPVSETTGVDNA